MRLARYSNVSDKYCLNMQNDIDICNAKMTMNGELDNVNNFVL